MGYQVTNFFAPNSRMGTPEDFKYLVNYLHKHNIGIILDWIPTHFSKDNYGLNKFDNTKLFENSGLKGLISKQSFYRWGTQFFDMKKPFVRAFLLSNALYWLKDFHIDGLRVDAVRCLLDSPSRRSVNLFLRQLNGMVHSVCKGTITIAEDYSGNEKITQPKYKNGMGFDYTFNIGWTHFVLDFFSTPIKERSSRYSDLIKAIESFNTQRCVLGISHDEVKKGKRSLLNKLNIPDLDLRIANTRALLSLMMITPGKKLNFMGNDIGAENEWDIYLEKGSPGFIKSESTQKGKQIGLMLKHLNKLYQTHSALFNKDANAHDLDWIEKDDPGGSIIAFRRLGATPIACFHNITQERVLFDVRIDSERVLSEIFNSDQQEYGGSGLINNKIKFIYTNGVISGYRIIVPPLSTVMISECSIS